MKQITLYWRRTRYYHSEHGYMWQVALVRGGQTTYHLVNEETLTRWRRAAKTLPVAA